MIKTIEKTVKENTRINQTQVSGCKTEINSLSLYFNELGLIPLLTREEEEETALEAMKGNAAAREKLARGNLRFVVKIAKKYCGRGLPFEDLISEGNIGLLRAVETFDISKGYHFITYAVWWIRHYIQKAVTEKTRMIRLPQNKIDALVRIEAIRDRMNWQSENTEIEELAITLDMTPAEVVELINLGREPLYLESHVSLKRDKVLLSDCIEDASSMKPEEYAMEKIMHSEIENALLYLSERDSAILKARYGLGGEGIKSLEELAYTLKISKEGIRQIEGKAIQRLKESIQCIRLENYVA